MHITNYNDWISCRSMGSSIDGYDEIAVKDMNGTWRVVARFEESDDYKTTKVRQFVSSLLYKGQPVSHDSRTI